MYNNKVRSYAYNLIFETFKHILILSSVMCKNNIHNFVYNNNILLYGWIVLNYK